MKVRFAPSPTGYLHIGGLRTCLYDYLLAKKEKGDYILRIEDTDQGRLVDDATKKLIETLIGLGIVHDEGPFIDETGNIEQIGPAQPYIQSERLAIYRQYVEQLIADGHAYYCFCSKTRLDSVREDQKKNGLTPKYDGLCRDIDIDEAERRIAAGEPYVVRLKIPADQDISFDDQIRGTVTFNTAEIDDQVLLKQDGFPTYHLAVVVDDHLMGVSHVIRGEEWITSTPKHIALYDAFGWQPPQYIHLPLILNSEKKKLSKRHDDASVEDFLKKGYLKEALINYVALLGWSPPDGSEIMSLAEIVDKFSIDRLSKSPAVFDVDKLRWMNGQYIRDYDLDALTELAIPFFIAGGTLEPKSVPAHRGWLKKIVAASRARVETLADFAEQALVFKGDATPPISDSARRFLEGDFAAVVIKALIAELEKIDKLCYDEVKPMLKTVQQTTGYKGKQLFMTVRIAISGQEHGVDLNDLLFILGRKRLIKRLNYTLENYMK
ncbi:MAG: glutamate--tRNA ligase [Clostridiales bacterium]|nr:MAG: glutamate--tRNA ligase [Clostridiales bacterium]